MNTSHVATDRLSTSPGAVGPELSPCGKRPSYQAARPRRRPFRQFRPGRRRLRPVTALVLVLIAGTVWGQQLENFSTDAESRYTYHNRHDPNGIGKFYMGREIARVMGFAGAPWLERDTREEEERLSLLVKSLDVKPDMVVADIGAGSGVIAMLIAEQLGDGGRVMAVDVQEEMLDRLRERARKRNVTNIVTVRGTSTTPKLAPETVDLAIMVDVYHEFDYPFEMLLGVSHALKLGGRVAFVEYRKEDPTVPIKLVHKMTEAQVIKEASLPEVGLRWKETIGVLPRQHIVIFERVASLEKSIGRPDAAGAAH